MIIGNEIGIEGAKAIGETLKINTSLTELHLGIMKIFNRFSFPFVIIYGEWNWR